MSHTPGPWEARPLGAILRPVKIEGSGAWRIHPKAGPCFAYLPSGRTEIQEANARLIAAAPELLEALKILLYGDEIGEAECQRTGYPRLIQRHEMALAAIAKAEGKS